MPSPFPHDHAAFRLDGSDSEDGFGSDIGDIHASTIEEFCLGTRCIVHIDLDCFYCQVEHKRLAIPTAVPLAVQQWQGLIAVNYAARAAGVARHDNITEAREKCPDIKFVHVATYAEGDPEFKYHEMPRQQTHKVSLEPYREASMQIFKIIAKYAKTFERASVDEAYLDVTDFVIGQLKEDFTDLTVGTAEITSRIAHYMRNHDAEVYLQTTPKSIHDLMLLVAAQKTREIREAIFNELKFTCSAGIAHNKTLAKLCSSLHKPNKQTILLETAAIGFLQELPISKIRMLGGKLGAKVESTLSIKKCGELQQFTLAQLLEHFDPESAKWLYEICRGVCQDQVVERNAAKSMMAAKSLRPAVTSIDALHPWLTILCGELFSRVQDGFDINNRWPKTLIVTTKSSINFEDRSRSGSFPTRNSIGVSYEVLLSRAMQILQSSTLGVPGNQTSLFPVARVAVSCSGFEEYSGASIADIFGKASANIKSDPSPEKDIVRDVIPPAKKKFSGPIVPISVGAKSQAKDPEPEKPKGSTLLKFFDTASSTSCSGSQKPRAKFGTQSITAAKGSFVTSLSSQKTKNWPMHSNTSSPKKRKSTAGAQSSSILTFAQGRELTNEDYDANALEKSSDGSSARCPKCNLMQPIDQIREHLDWHMAIQLSKLND